METELDRLVPEVTPLTLSTGFEVNILRMKTRQFFRLLKVITHGAGPRLVEMGFDFEAEPEVFAGRLATLVAMSIPDAETETLAFLDSMGEPAGLHGGEGGRQASELNRQEKDADAALWQRYHAELFNPDPMDTFTLVEAIVRRESEDVQALGKRFAALVKMAQKTGQDEPGAPEETPQGSDLHLPSREPSPGPSTSSATSTGGPTGTSSASPSAGSGRPPRRHQIAGAQSS